MARTVSIGHQDFETLRKNNYFYIDKTKFIYEWWEKGDSVTLITRPRRSGKTLNLRMLEQFFSVKYAGRGDLFEGLDIWKHENYRQIQGTYPVIFLSFANIKENNFKEARAAICRTIEELFNKADFVLEGNLLNEKEKAFYQEIDVSMSDSTASASIRALSDFLYRYYGKKTIILLDEYDTPMQEAYVNGYWQELVDFTRGLFNSAFKTNPYLERAVMTGITRVSKESIFSDLNNLKIVTTTSEEYEDSFGFTEQEVFAALDEYGLSDRRQEVKVWYDGFAFGKLTEIYNPWSLINYLDTGRAVTYWANTSSNGLVSKLIREGSGGLKETFEVLLKGGVLQTEIDEQIVFDQLTTTQNAIWSLLLACGYLKMIKYEADEDGGKEQYTLALTNKEVRIMFEKMVRDWFSRSGDAYNNFIRALLQDDLDAMNAYMNRVALTIFSYFDTGREPSEEEPERFYHGFVLGLMVELTGRYLILSNRESGFGRYDVILEPVNLQDHAIIMEFKVMNPRREKCLEDTVRSALDQIERKKYETVLIERGFAKERIRKYGFAFRGKTVLIDAC